MGAFCVWTDDVARCMFAHRLDDKQICCLLNGKTHETPFLLIRKPLTQFIYNANVMHTSNAKSISSQSALQNAFGIQYNKSVTCKTVVVVVWFE